MPYASCRQCGASFYVKPSHVARGWGKFCTAKCLHASMRTGEHIKCLTCGRDVYRTNRQFRHSKSGNFFCNRSCSASWKNSLRVGKKHPNWKGGGYTYRSILSRDKTAKACVLCGTDDKRVLAVHHIDHDHNNNVLANLAWLCHNCHHLVHHDNVERQRFIYKISAR